MRSGWLGQMQERMVPGLQEQDQVDGVNVQTSSDQDIVLDNMSSTVLNGHTGILKHNVPAYGRLIRGLATGKSKQTQWKMSVIKQKLLCYGFLSEFMPTEFIEFSYHQVIVQNYSLDATRYHV